MMQARIKIIKRGAGGNANGVSANESEKTVQQCEREMANTVKSWVTEWEARNRALKTAAASLVHSLSMVGGISLTTTSRSSSESRA